MKTLLTLLLINLFYVGYGQKDTATKPIIDSSFLDWDLGNCLVAHCTEDGCFSCDYKGHYYPYLIINDSIRKWFVKMDGNDSLFYYRHKDDTANYIWNGDKKDECGYDLKYNGEVVSSLCQRYDGKDTIQRIQQVWRSIPPNPKPSPLPKNTVVWMSKEIKP